MSSHDEVFEKLVTEMAHRAAADRLRQEGFGDAAEVLDSLAAAAYAAYRAAVEQRNTEIEEHRLERIAQRWAEADRRPKPMLNPRQKNFVHQVTLKAEPEEVWLVDNIRVPFRFYKDMKGQLFFTSRCQREAAAVKLMFG